MEKRLEETALGTLDDKKERFKVLQSGEKQVMKARAAIAREFAENEFHARRKPEHEAFDEKLKEYAERRKAAEQYSVNRLHDIWNMHERICGGAVKENTQRLSADAEASVRMRSSNNAQQPLVPPRHRKSAVVSGKRDRVCPTPAQPQCASCNRRVYLAERLTIEDVTLHKRCFRCSYCDNALRVGSATIDRCMPDGTHFYCNAHRYLPVAEKVARLRASYVTEEEPQSKVEPQQRPKAR